MLWTTKATKSTTTKDKREFWLFVFFANFFYFYFHNINFDWGSHRIVTYFSFFCVESFFMLHILFVLMLKRDGKWRLPVIYNRSVQATKGNIRLTQTPTQAIFTRDFFSFFITYALSLFYISVCCFFSFVLENFLRTRQ